MSKSIKRFLNPNRTAEDYDALLLAYRGALVQLQRAGQLVAKLKGRPRGERRELTESECFMVEAAMYHGFEMIDDAGTVFKCTQEQIVSLLQGAKKDSLDAVLAFARYLTVDAPWPIKLNNTPESEKALKGIAQQFFNRREGGPIPTMPAEPQGCPLILLDAKSVADALTPAQQKRTSPENVVDALDAVFRVLYGRPTAVTRIPCMASQAEEQGG